jgi:hypothetical protein
MSSRYIFDKDGIRFRRKKTSVWAVVRRILMFFVASLSLAVVYYVIFSLVFSTDEEKKLRQENRMYAREYPELERKEQLLSDVVDGLMVRDDDIYSEIFHTSAPDVNPLSSIDFLSGYDSIPDHDIVLRSAAKLDLAGASAARVEENFRRIAQVLGEEGYSIPPMTNPLKNYSFAQTGASTGSRINPFYKVSMQHNGLDMIAPSGEPVYAAADGKIEKIWVDHMMGCCMAISHSGNCITIYKNLSDTLPEGIAQGVSVRAGQLVANVGDSAMVEIASEPHLHFEMTVSDLAVDPLEYFDENSLESIKTDASHE